MGILSKAIGAIFSGTGIVILMYGSSSDAPLSMVWFFLGLFVLSLGFSMITAGRQTREQKPPPPTITEIRCDSKSCDFKEIRNFEKGDYILKPVQAPCPKCGQSMTVQGVYIVKEEDERDKTTF
ncbi:MAG: hypothetical protein HXY34_13520 [Candidatus Thorarchaeota archaeon]|nr:hypothetical protein [Candidatus Thorarchaeota archaeon]